VPVKRRVAKGRLHRITDDAIVAWRIGDKVGLHRALDLRPWQSSPFDVDDAGRELLEPLIAVTADVSHGHAIAADLRRELLRHGAPGRVGRHGRPWSAEDDAKVAAGEWDGVR
jgi:hypothetical protein